MLRRAFTLLSFISATAFAIVLAFYVRGYFAHDDLHIVRWNPTTFTFTEIALQNRTRGIVFHSESTAVGPKAKAAPLRAKAGTRVTSSPGAMGAVDPLFWADHYRCTPEPWLTGGGLSDCRTVQLRTELPLTALAILPTVWGVGRFLRARRAARRGFAVAEKQETAALSNVPRNF